MRKISTKIDQKKKQKRNNLIIGGILVLLMIMSVFGIIVNSFDFSGSKTQNDYNGQEFVEINGLWNIGFGDTTLAFSYLPNETDSIAEVSGVINPIYEYQGKTLYVQSEDYYSTNELYNSIYPFVSRMQFACESEENCENPDYPIKDCSENFILIKRSNNSIINQTENCVYIEGPLEDLPKITDEFLFKIFGIKN